LFYTEVHIYYGTKAKNATKHQHCNSMRNSIPWYFQYYEYTVTDNCQI